MQLDLALLETRQDIAALAPEWDALVRESPGDLKGLDATSTYAWFEAAMVAFPEASEPKVVVCRQQGVLLGLLPIVVHRRHPLGQEFCLVTDLYGGRNAALQAAPDARILAALLGHLTKAFPNWVSLAVTLRSDSPQSALLREACSLLGWHSSAHSLPGSPSFPLLESDEVFRSRLSKNLQQNLRSSRNRASKLGALSFHEFSTVEQAGPLMEAVLTIERASWKHAAGTAISCHPRQQAFYEALLPRAARSGMLLGLVLYLGDQPIAHNFGLIRQEVYCCLKQSHAEAFDPLGPSALLMLELLARLRKRSVTRFDFMGVTEPHKLRWSDDNLIYERCTVMVYNNTLRSRVLQALRHFSTQFRERTSIVSPDRADPAATRSPATPDRVLEVMSPGLELAALAPQWNALVCNETSRLAGMDITAGYCWFEALVQSRDQAARARVLVMRKGNELLGLMPLVEGSRCRLGTQIQMATELYGGRSGFLLRQPDLSNATEMLGNLDRAYPDWLTLQWTLPKDSESLQLLLAIAREQGMLVQLHPLPPAPYLNLLESPEQFNEGVSRSLLQKMRQSQRKAVSAGRLHFREFRDPEDADAMVEMLLAVERKSWKHGAGTAISAHPEQEAFYRALAVPAMQQGLLYTLALYLDEEPISYQLGLIRDSVYYCLKNTMDQFRTDLRPSYLLKAELFNRVRALGVRTVDLMGVVEPHKLVWAAKTPIYERLHVTLYRRSLPARTLALARSIKSRFARQPAPSETKSDPAQLST